MHTELNIVYVWIFLNTETFEGRHLISRVVYIQANIFMYDALFLRNFLKLIFLQEQPEGVHSGGKVQRLKKFKQPLYVDMLLMVTIINAFTNTVTVNKRSLLTFSAAFSAQVDMLSPVKSGSALACALLPPRRVCRKHSLRRAVPAARSRILVEARSGLWLMLYVWSKLSLRTLMFLWAMYQTFVHQSLQIQHKLVPVLHSQHTCMC